MEEGEEEEERGRGRGGDGKGGKGRVWKRREFFFSRNLNANQPSKRQ